MQEPADRSPGSELHELQLTDRHLQAEASIYWDAVVGLVIDDSEQPIDAASPHWREDSARLPAHVEADVLIAKGKPPRAGQVRPFVATELGEWVSALLAL